MKNFSVVKSILALKLGVVFLALAIHSGWIHVGDLQVFAEDTKDKQTPTTANKKASADEGLEDEKEAVAATKRKSFLSELFELPKLNAKKVKKEEIGKYLDMAERKERQISERTSQLSRREDQLKALEKSIDEKLGKLEDERKFIAKTLQQEKDLKGERLDKIAELYDKMDPKKAAPAFEKLDKDLTVALFKKLKQKQVTTILETMNPEKSVELTEYFARVKSAKEYDLLRELNESLKKEFQDCKGMVEGSTTAMDVTASGESKSVNKESPAPDDPADKSKTETSAAQKP